MWTSRPSVISTRPRTSFLTSARPLKTAINRHVSTRTQELHPSLAPTRTWVPAHDPAATPATLSSPMSAATPTRHSVPRTPSASGASGSTIGRPRAGGLQVPVWNSSLSLRNVRSHCKNPPLNPRRQNPCQVHASPQIENPRCGPTTLSLGWVHVCLQVQGSRSNQRREGVGVGRALSR